MVRWLERNGYDVSYTTGVDTDRRGSELLEHRTFLSVGHDEYWSGGQRGKCRGGPGRGRQPCVLQRQRGLLEDEVGAEHRRHLHQPSNARFVQGDAGGREDRPEPRVDGNVARSALQPAVRRRPSRERAHGHDLHGEQLPGRRDVRPRRIRRAALLAQHQHRDPAAGPAGDIPCGNAGARVGRGPRQRLSAGGNRQALVEHLRRPELRHRLRRAGHERQGRRTT